MLSQAKVDELLDAVVTVLHQVSTDSDLDDKVSAPEKYGALETMLRRALLGTPYEYLAGEERWADARAAEMERLANLYRCDRCGHELRGPGGQGW